MIIKSVSTNKPINDNILTITNFNNGVLGLPNLALMVFLYFWALEGRPCLYLKKPFDTPMREARMKYPPQ